MAQDSVPIFQFPTTIHYHGQLLHTFVSSPSNNSGSSGVVGIYASTVEVNYQFGNQSSNNVVLKIFRDYRAFTDEVEKIKWINSCFPDGLEELAEVLDYFTCIPTAAAGDYEVADEDYEIKPEEIPLGIVVMEQLEKQQQTEFTEEQGARFLCEMASTFSLLEESGLTYFDCKPENIMVRRTSQGLANVLIDYGGFEPVCTVDCQYCQSNCGHPFYGYTPYFFGWDEVSPWSARKSNQAIHSLAVTVLLSIFPYEMNRFSSQNCALSDGQLFEIFGFIVGTKLSRYFIQILAKMLDRTVGFTAQSRSC